MPYRSISGLLQNHPDLGIPQRTFVAKAENVRIEPKLTV